jgi:SAM-dependent methyltransferase
MRMTSSGGRNSQEYAYIGASDSGEGERLVAAAASAPEELRAALALHAPPPHARVLELGCGPGAFTRALLAALPEATVTAIDRDVGLLDTARQRLAQEAESRSLTFVQADAQSLPFAARSFDLVVCRCLLMHLADPQAAVGEMFRVAEIGGVALAIEPDWGTKALYPDGEALDALLALARRARPYGFPDMLLGRKLYAFFRAGGFADVRVQTLASSQTAAELASAQQSVEDKPTAGPGRLLEQGRALLRAAGLADDAALDALIARLRAVRRNPEYFSAGVDFVAAGVKPDPLLVEGERFL